MRKKFLDRIFVVAFALELTLMSVPEVTNAQSLDALDLCDVATVQVDNDEMGGTDRHYTAGIRVACVTSPPWFVRDLIESEPSPSAINHNRMTYAIGQSIFTPDNLARSEPIGDDQPYAGWLYLGFGLESDVIHKSDRLRYLDTFELQLGVIGPLSGAEQVQRIGHDLTGATDPKGWGNQLDNEPGLNLFYSRQWTGAQEFSITSAVGIPDLFFDLTPQLGFALGNVHIFSAGGLSFRLGSFLPDDQGPPSTRPSLSGSGYFPRHDGVSAYVFGGLEGRVVGRNLFLDGNTFDDDGPSVSKNRFVAEARLGMALTLDDVRIAYTQVFRGSEFEGQPRNSFGAVSLSVRF